MLKIAEAFTLSSNSGGTDDSLEAAGVFLFKNCSKNDLTTLFVSVPVSAATLSSSDAGQLSSLFSVHVGLGVALDQQSLVVTVGLSAVLAVMGSCTICSIWSVTNAAIKSGKITCLYTVVQLLEMSLQFFCLLRGQANLLRSRHGWTLDASV